MTREEKVLNYFNKERELMHTPTEEERFEKVIRLPILMMESLKKDDPLKYVEAMSKSIDKVVEEHNKIAFPLGERVIVAVHMTPEEYTAAMIEAAQEAADE